MSPGRGKGRQALGWVVEWERTHPGASVKASQAFTPSDGGDFQGTWFLADQRSSPVCGSMSWFGPSQQVLQLLKLEGNRVLRLSEKAGYPKRVRSNL